MTTPSTVSDEPPPYPGSSGPPPPPPYETATALHYRDDAYRLPSYQSRTGQRYHPYMRILPVHRGYIPHQEKSFEEFYRSLQASVNRRRVVPPTAVTGASSANAPPAPLRPSAQAPTNHQAPPIVEPPVVPPPLPARHLGQDTEERYRRLIRRLFFLPEILKIVRARLGAAMRAVEARF